MKLKTVTKFQEGGAVAPQAPAGGGDPMQELAMACQQALEAQDCQLALQVCQVVMEMLSGNAAPAEAAPAPAPAPEASETEPVYRKGGILVRRIKK